MNAYTLADRAALVPLRREHFTDFDPHPRQAAAVHALVDGGFRDDEIAGCFALVADGRVGAIVGIDPRYAGVAILYFYLAADTASPAFTTASLHLRRHLDGLGYDRIEALAEPGYTAAETWLCETLGFARETAIPMRKALAGRDYHLWAKIAPDAPLAAQQQKDSE